jgi:hypothetical protein
MSISWHIKSRGLWWKRSHVDWAMRAESCERWVVASSWRWWRVRRTWRRMLRHVERRCSWRRCAVDEDAWLGLVEEDGPEGVALVVVVVVVVGGGGGVG